MIVAVLGAGAAGLSAALELRALGHEPIVLEAAARAGGKLGTDRAGGWLTERAAVGLLDRKGQLAPLAAQLGLSPQPAAPSAKKRWAVRDGKLKSPLGAFTLRELASALREPWRPAGDASAETVRDFFVRRLGPGGAYFADALQTGIYAGDAEQLEVAACFPSLPELEREHGGLVRGLRARPKRAGPRPRLTSFAGGLEELTAGLAARLGPALRLSVRAKAIRAEQGRYRLTLLEEAGLTELVADAVVVAVPAPDAALLLEPLDPLLPPLLRELQAAPIAVVHLGVRRQDVGGAVDGFGLVAPGRAVVGTLLPSSIFAGRAPPGRVLFSSLVGGAKHPAAARLPDRELFALVRSELELTMRLRPGAQAELQQIVRWPAAIPQYTRGHLARIAALEGHLARHPRLALTGAWYRGVSVLDCLHDGRVQARAICR